MDQTDFLAGETRHLGDEEVQGDNISLNSHLASIRQKKKELRNQWAAKTCVFTPEACLPVHVDERGIEPTDVVAEAPCSLDHVFLMNKNVTTCKLAQQKGATCADLELRVPSNFLEQYDPENSYVALLVEANEYTLYRVIETEKYPNISSDFYTVTCENVPLKLFNRLQSIFDQPARLESAEKKVLPLLRKSN
ncbi:hypothetical protein Bpfe_006111 [Biomphalaria pfeifferi]|uniref:Uncharacterized protein n=1 Tax=Biomphalaria pfeifferi TaxID=112525 RepID=A0AAD8C0W6_BIOPF|nr:hypothetical protein Bpfe_006111 [Biomphalaria pfeifferi]